MRAGIIAAVLILGACGDDDARSRDAGFDAVVDFPDAAADVAPDRGIPPDTSVSRCEPDATLGNFCRSDADCNDVCFCNGQERCRGGVCVAGISPCDDGIACTVDLCEEEETSCTSEADDTVCDDGNPCTGDEICDPEVGCLDGLPPNCSDGDSCTIDRCDPVDGCVRNLRDVDGDGFADSRCEGGDDCNDDPLSGGDVNPGVAEVCDNEVDDDCDGAADIFDDDCAPGNDTCETPFVLGGPGFYGWSTQTLTDDYSLGCEGSDPLLDAVFLFTLGVESDVRIATNGPRNAAIEIRSADSCADDEEEAIACDRKTSTSGLAEIEERRLAPGNYVVIAGSPQEALYQLTFDVTPSTPPPAFDSCATAPEISAGGVLAGELMVLTDQHARPSCQGSSAEFVEAAYRLTLAEPQDVVLRATAASSTGSGRDVGLAIVRDCDMVVDTEVACEEGRTPEIVRRPLEAGTYFVLVEPNSTTATDYELRATITPPVPRAEGDSCATAIDITDRSATVDVAALENDGGLGCGGDAPPWVDAFFTVEVATRSAVEFAFDPGVVHLYSLGTTCGDSATDLLCQSGIPTTTRTEMLEPGTYALGVAVPTSSGTFTVATTVTPE
ncbi:MAG: hypothetical protein AAGE52_01780 [Myxococcota bacterium]